MTTIPAHVAITEAAIGGKVLLLLFVWLISGAAGSSLGVCASAAGDAATTRALTNANRRLTCAPPRAGRPILTVALVTAAHRFESICV